MGLVYSQFEMSLIIEPMGLDIGPIVGRGIELNKLDFLVELTWMGHDIEPNRSMTWLKPFDFLLGKKVNTDFCSYSHKLEEISVQRCDIQN